MVSVAVDLYSVLRPRQGAIYGRQVGSGATETLSADRAQTFTPDHSADRVSLSLDERRRFRLSQRYAFGN